MITNLDADVLAADAKPLRFVLCLSSAGDLSVLCLLSPTLELQTTVE